MNLRVMRSCSAILILGAAPLGSQSKLDLRNQTRSVDFSAATATKPARMGSTLPASCGQGEFFFLSSAPAGQNLYVCAAANTWALQGGAVPQSSLVPTELNNAGKLLSTDGSNPVWQAIGGDVSGAPSALTVGGLRGKTLSTATPTDGQLLRFNAGSNVWEPAALAGDVHGNPSTLTVNGLQGRGVSSLAPTDGQLLKFNGMTGFWEPVAIGGDVNGAPAALTVAGLQGRTVSSAAPISGQLLSWSNTNSTWTPTTLQVPPNYSVAFTGTTLLSIAGTQHNLNTANLLVSCYDNAAPANLIEPGQITIDPATYNVTVKFATPQSGRCSVNGSGGVGMGATAIAGSAPLTFPTVNTAACSGELTVPLPGAQVTDSVVPGWPALPAGFFGMARVSAAGVVAIRVCNFSGGNVALPTLTYGATIVRPF